MYTVLVAVKNQIILQELKNLRIWGGATGFEICEVTSDFDRLEEKLQERHYHLVLLEAAKDNHVLTLLRTIQNKKLCKAIAVVSEHPDFKTVRKSFLLGVDDYLAVPFEISQFITLFRKIENAEHGKLAAEIYRKEELLQYFAHANGEMKEYLDELLYSLLSEFIDQSEAFSYLKRILDGAMEDIFQEYPWLNYYFQINDYSLSKDNFADYEKMIEEGIEDFYEFFLEFTELYPPHGEGAEEIIRYILEHPEGALKQKNLAEALYVNRSYLSTVFAGQIQVSFVEYVNTVKMKRAAYLLKHTQKKVIDIAGALEYKDMGYFLKKFKNKYGVTPSQYRIPENYDFQI